MITKTLTPESKLSIQNAPVPNNTSELQSKIIKTTSFHSIITDQVGGFEISKKFTNPPQEEAIAKAMQARLNLNPYKFFANFLRVSMEVCHGRRDPIQLQKHALLEVIDALSRIYRLNRQNTNKALFRPISILHLHGYRVNKEVSELSATIMDNGVRKLCIARAEFRHEVWKISYLKIMSLAAKSPNKPS